MSFLHRTSETTPTETTPTDAVPTETTPLGAATTKPATTEPATTEPATTEPAPPNPTAIKTRVPGTRTGATWVGICAATVLLVALIVFMLQNTRSVQISFLWMHGSVPLALALLIAGVGVGILAMVVGTARITQLRRLARGRRDYARRD
jgi:uncharacterized integral membrane protein